MNNNLIDDHLFTFVENHSVAPNPPVRHDSMQLTVDMESTQRAISNQSLVNEELSNQILEEIEAIEQGRLEVDSRPPDERVPAAGYTELADCTTGSLTSFYRFGSENDKTINFPSTYI